jgi:hypothetical protein
MALCPNAVQSGRYVILARGRPVVHKSDPLYTRAPSHIYKSTPERSIAHLRERRQQKRCPDLDAQAHRPKRSGASLGDPFGRLRPSCHPRSGSLRFAVRTEQRIPENVFWSCTSTSDVRQEFAPPQPSGAFTGLPTFGSMAPLRPHGPSPTRGRGGGLRKSQVAPLPRARGRAGGRGSFGTMQRSFPKSRRSSARPY